MQGDDWTPEILPTPVTAGVVLAGALAMVVVAAWALRRWLR